MTRIGLRSWMLAAFALSICLQSALFAQEDGNASIMAGMDSNASELAGSRGSDLVTRRTLGGSTHPSASVGPKSFHAGNRRSNPTAANSQANRIANPTVVGFEPFGITHNQGGQSVSAFRVYGNGYGLGYSRSYFGNYGQGYGTGYSRSYFGNYGYGYGIGYGPNQ